MQNIYFHVASFGVDTDSFHEKSLRLGSVTYFAISLDESHILTISGRKTLSSIYVYWIPS